MQNDFQNLTKYFLTCILNFLKIVTADYSRDGWNLPKFMNHQQTKYKIMKKIINNIASVATWGGIIAFFGIESNPSIAGAVITFLVLSTVTYLASYEPENDVRHED